MKHQDHPESLTHTIPQTNSMHIDHKLIQMTIQLHYLQYLDPNFLAHLDDADGGMRMYIQKYLAISVSIRKSQGLPCLLSNLWYFTATQCIFFF